MPKIMQDLIKQYVEAVKKIYGSHVRQIILYGSYARGTSVRTLMWTL